MVLKKTLCGIESFAMTSVDISFWATADALIKVLSVENPALYQKVPLLRFEEVFTGRFTRHAYSQGGSACLIPPFPFHSASSFPVIFRYMLMCILSAIPNLGHSQKWWCRVLHHRNSECGSKLPPDWPVHRFLFETDFSLRAKTSKKRNPSKLYRTCEGKSSLLESAARARMNVARPWNETRLCL